MWLQLVPEAHQPVPQDRRAPSPGAFPVIGLIPYAQSRPDAIGGKELAVPNGGFMAHPSVASTAGQRLGRPRALTDAGCGATGPRRLARAAWVGLFPVVAILASPMAHAQQQYIVECPTNGAVIVQTQGTTCAYVVLHWPADYCYCGYSSFFYNECLSDKWGLPDATCGVNCYDLVNPFSSAPCIEIEPNSPPCPNGGCPEVGRPVNVATGEVHFTQTDAVLGDLAFTRTYNSQRWYWPRHGMFGPGWNSSVEMRLRIVGRRLEARLADGTPIYYFDDDPVPDGIYEQAVPYGRDSWIETVPGVGYRKMFRAGGFETYDTGGRIVSIQDAAGVVTSYGRDGQGRVTNVTRLGRSLTLGYEGSSTAPATLRGPGDVVIATYGYPSGKLDSVTYADGPDENTDPDGGFTFQYNTAGLIETVKDRDNKVVETHYYDASGRGLTSSVSGEVELYTIDYAPGGDTSLREVRSRRNPGQLEDDVTTYYIKHINGLPYVWKITGLCSSCGGSGSETQKWTYDDKGRVLAYEDGVGNVTSYTYDAETGDLLTESRVADPNNPTTTTHTTTYTYWTDGRVKTKTEPNGQVTAYWYVAAGPETVTEQVTATESRTTRFEYDTPTGKVWKVTDPLLRITEFHYTPVGDLEWVKDPLQHQTSFEYDSMGRRTRTILPVTTPANAEPTTTYDTLGRVYRVTNPDPDNSYTEFTYDGGGHRTRVRDFLGRLTNYHYDAYGRLDTVTDPDNKETVYGYDLMSHLTSIRDARLKTTGFEVDAYGRVRSVTYPGNRVEEFTYDSAGRLRTRKDRNGVTTTYGYDGLWRLTTKTYDNGSPAVAFTYDEGPLAHKGRLTTAANVTETLTWTYDLAAQVRSEASAFNGTTVGYDYYVNGKRKTLDLGGWVLSYDYYEDGMPWHIYRTGSNPLTFTLAYDEAHRQRNLTFPNSAATTYTPDLLSRLEDVSTVVGGSPVVHASYVHDAAGNRVSRGGDEPAAYLYDALDRLKRVDSAPSWETYTYDAVGNRLTHNDKSLWSYNDRNELLSHHTWQYAYDKNGSLIQGLATGGTGDQDWAYEWSAEKELARVVKNGVEVARFRYDPLGRRVEKVAQGVSTKFAYDAEDVLQALSGATSRRYIHGPGIDEPLGEDAAGTMRYYHADALGSIAKMTDASGAVAFMRTYDSFGNPLSGADHSGYAFTGREWDPETGLYYYRARYYDPRLGRFTSEDPIGLRGGLNLYHYVFNNPAKSTDPFGKVATEFKYCALHPYNCAVSLGCAMNARLEAAMIDPDMNGYQDNSETNAMVHCTWACCLTQKLGGQHAINITENHEADVPPPNTCDSNMDRHNNMQGVALGGNAGIDCNALCAKYANLKCRRDNGPCTPGGM